MYFVGNLVTEIYIFKKFSSICDGWRECFPNLFALDLSFFELHILCFSSSRFVKYSFWSAHNITFYAGCEFNGFNRISSIYSLNSKTTLHLIENKIKWRELFNQSDNIDNRFWIFLQDFWHTQSIEQAMVDKKWIFTITNICKNQYLSIRKNPII